MSKTMLQRFFQRVKVIIVLCLFISVALPSVTHAFDMTSAAHCEEVSVSGDMHHTQSAQEHHQKTTDHKSDGCDCCHSGCCNFKTIQKLDVSMHSADMEVLSFQNLSEFVADTVGSGLFRPPKSLV